jgi:site-specific DNA recombinase
MIVAEEKSSVATAATRLDTHLAAHQDSSTSTALHLRDRDTLARLVAGIIVHTDKLLVRSRSDHTGEEPDR